VRRTGIAVFAVTVIALLAPRLAFSDEPKARVLGEMDRSLRSELQRAVGVSKAHPASRIDARRRAREASELVIAVLRTEGYYDYTIEPDVGDGDTPTPLLRVTPGPRSLIADVKVVWDGDPPDPDTLGASQTALALKPGTPGRAADVLAAEGRIVAALRKRGYADAAVNPRQVVVDHADHTVQPTFHVSAGQLAHLDGLKVISQGRTRAAWVALLAPWKRGAVYDPAKVAELERRLRDAGVYNSVTVALAPPDEAVDGLRPVVVSLGDRPAHTVELGAGYSTSEGAGVDAKYITYNRLGRADTINLTARLAQIQQKFDTELDLPDWRRGDQILKVGADVFGDDTSAYDDEGLGVRADVERHWTKTTYVTVGGAVDFVDTLEKDAINNNGIAVGERLKLVIYSTLGGIFLDRSNDPLNPTRGWRLQVQAEPTYITGDRVLPYLKLTTQGSYYLPFGQDASTVLAARVKFGAIVGGDIPDVPDDRRFFAGGGGSVRGFSYQGVGPQLADGTPIGGDSLYEGSLELRQHVTGPWSVVAFVDTGSLGPTAAPDFNDLALGAGLGVRYDLGFAPIRLDVATPLTRRQGEPIAQLYVSIGQAF
jgi:translocation and assembly module TamA